MTVAVELQVGPDDNGRKEAHRAGEEGVLAFLRGGGDEEHRLGNLKLSRQGIGRGGGRGGRRVGLRLRSEGGGRQAEQGGGKQPAVSGGAEEREAS